LSLLWTNILTYLLIQFTPIFFILIQIKVGFTPSSERQQTMWLLNCLEHFLFTCCRRQGSLRSPQWHYYSRKNHF